MQFQAEDYEIFTFENIQLHYSYACIATEIGDFSLSHAQFELARTLLNDALRVGYGPKPKLEVNILGGIANSLNGLGRNEEAEKYYLDCLKLGKPNNIRSAYEVNICRCRWAAGKFEPAKKRLEELISLREEKYHEDDEVDYLYEFSG